MRELERELAALAAPEQELVVLAAPEQELAVAVAVVQGQGPEQALVDALAGLERIPAVARRYRQKRLLILLKALQVARFALS